ncbi:MAG: aldehyde dehydrogenase family protein [bacterium]|nr:aldehyde dehydrogenase family protein [bacterium]
MTTSSLSKGTGGTLTIKNPYTNEDVDNVPLLSQKELRDIVESSAVFSSSLTPFERYSILQRASELVMRDKEEISTLISKESGLSLKDTTHEVERTRNVLLLSAEAAKAQEGKVYQSDVVPQSTSRMAFTIREPVGLVLAITPFNHPLNQVVHKVGPAIAMNNTVLLKPSMKTPLSAIRFKKLMLEAGLPAEMLTILTCDIQTDGRFLLSDPSIDMVTFTGSTQTGESIAKEIGVKKSLMELGGNDVCVLCEDADVDALLEIIVKGGFGNSGQRCTSIKRLLCHESIADYTVNLLKERISSIVIGNPLDAGTQMGTVIDETAAKIIEERINTACSQGAVLVTGGNRKGALLEPTLLDYIKPEMEIVDKETFGPVLPIIRFSSDEEAIDIANDTEYGLQAGVCTQNIKRSMYYARKLQTGAVHINQASGYRVESWPFGGIKKSGIGKEGVERACLEMTNEKLISFDFPSI